MVSPYLTLWCFFLPFSHIFCVSHSQRQDFDLPAGLIWCEKAAHTSLQHLWFLALSHSLACSVVSALPSLASWVFWLFFKIPLSLFCILAWHGLLHFFS